MQPYTRSMCMSHDTARVLVTLLVLRLHVTYFSLTPPSPSCRKTHTQLLLWPNFRTSPPAVSSSPALRNLVFASYTSTSYTHTTHRIFPMKTCATTSAELMEISHTISDAGRKEEREVSPSSSRDSIQDPSPLSRSSRSTASSSSNSGSGVVSLESSGHQQRAMNGLRHVTGTCNSSLPCCSSGEASVSGRDGAAPMKVAGKEGSEKTSTVGGSSSAQSVVNQNGVVHDSGENGMETEPQGASVESRSGSSPRREAVPHSQHPCMLTSMPHFLIAYAPKVSVTDPSLLRCTVM